MLPNERVARIVVWGLVAVGIALLAWQFAGGASLWIDELAIARNIAERPWGELLSQPLRYYQVAPLGFLTLEKAVVTLFGASDWTLRIVPVAAAIGALVIFAQVALRTLPSRAAIVAVAIMALAGRLIWNGSQVKQYATDVLAAVLVLWMTERWLAERSWSRTRVAITVGAAATFVSQPAIFVVVGAALALVISQWSVAEGAVRRRAVLVMLSWCVAAVVMTWLSRARVTPDVMSLMREYWAGGFAPFPPRSLSDVSWPWRAIRDLFGTTLALRWPAGYALLALAGGVALVRRSAFGMAIVAPLVVAMLASAFKVFPFQDRPVVFAVPLIALATAAGVEWLVRMLRLRSSAAALAFCLLFVVPPVLSIVRQPPVYRVQDAKPLLRTLAAQRRDGDRIYVYYGADPAMRWYASRFGIPIADAVFGGCHRGDPRAYLHELDALRGQPRVWIIVSHAEAAYGERETIMRYLDAIGTRRGFWSAPSPYVNSVASTDVALYDLSDQARLASLAADTAPIPAARVRADPRRDCRGPFAG